jgi:hypothetical protein
MYRTFAHDVTDSFVWNTNMAAMAFVQLVPGEGVQIKRFIYRPAV